METDGGPRPDRTRLLIVGLLGVIAALLIALAFVLVTRDGEGGEEAGTTSSTLASVSSTAPTTEASTTTDTATGLVGASAAPCTTDAIMPVVAGLFPDDDVPDIIAVNVLECQNGFARVIAIADQSACGPDFPNCLENEQVFLEDVDGAWEYVALGTGIDCNDPAGLGPEMIAACEALGLIDPSEPPLVSPANDDFADRIDLTGSQSAPVAGTSVNATLEDGEPLPPGLAPTSSVWWTWTAPELTLDTLLELSTAGSTASTVIGVWRGDSLVGLDLVAADDDPSTTDESLVKFEIESFETYHIAVYALDGAEGEIRLSFGFDL